MFSGLRVVAFWSAELRAITTVGAESLPRLKADHLSKNPPTGPFLQSCHNSPLYSTLVGEFYRRTPGTCATFHSVESGVPNDAQRAIISGFLGPPGPSIPPGARLRGQ